MQGIILDCTKDSNKLKVLFHSNEKGRPFEGQSDAEFDLTIHFQLLWPERPLVGRHGKATSPLGRQISNRKVSKLVTIS